jgi:hypothetical protein
MKFLTQQDFDDIIEDPEENKLILDQRKGRVDVKSKR